jgi:hypothetical protein
MAAILQSQRKNQIKYMSSLTKGQLSVFKKTVAVLTTLTTVLSLAGVAALPSVAQAAVPGDYGLQEGNTISASGTSDPDIYIVNAQGYKRLFLNPVIFNFYGHLGGFAAVKAVSATARDAFPTSGLFRNCEANDEKVYGVEVNGEDTGVLHWVNTTGAQAVADDANFFKKVFCINNNEFNWYAKGSNYTSVNQVPNYSRSTTPAPAGNLSASLAASNPASGTLVETQALADLAHFQVNGSGSVTSVELKRLGVSADTTLANVFLFVNGVRVSDSGSVAAGMVSFNNASGLFTAPAVLSVRSDIANGTSGQTVGVQLTKLNTSTVSVSGNIFTIAPDNNLATVVVGVPTGSGTIDPQNDVAVWTSSFTIGNEDVYLKRLTIREIGSIDSKDIRNLRLSVDGVQVATDADLDADGYATFLMNYRVTTGSRTVKVLADVIGGSTRTMEFSVRGAYDIEAMDESYGVNVIPTATGGFPADPAAQFTIGSPSVTAVKTTDSPSGDVTDEAYDVALARFELQAFGEAVKIETLGVRASVSSADAVGGLTGGRLLINGVQYGSTDNTFLTTATSSFTVNYTIAAGAKAIVEVRADLREDATDGTATNVGSGDIVSIILDGGTDVNNATGQVSATTVDVPGTSVESNNVTVATGSATLSKQTSYPEQIVTLPKTAYKVGAWVLTNGSAEAINVTNLSLDVNDASHDGSSFDQSDLSNLYVVYGGSTSSTKSTVAAADNDFSITRTLAKNETIVIEAYATLGSNVTVTDSVILDLSLTVTGASTGSSITSGMSDIAGQEIDTAAGSFTSSVDSTPAKLAVSNSAVSAGTWRFRGENESYTLSELRFKVTSGSQDTVNSITVNGVSQPLVLVSDDYVATFPGLNLAVGTELPLNVTVNTADINTNVPTGDNVKLTLEHVKYRDSSGVEATSTTDREGGAIYVHDAYPSLAKNDIGTALAVGSQTLGQFVVTPTNGTIGLNQVRFDITKTAGISIASTSANDFELYANGAPLDVASVSHSGLGTNQTSGYVIFEFASEQILGTATTYRLEANVLATGGTGKSINVSLNASSASATPAAAGAVTPGSALVWTDRSASGHAYTTSDWMNGYLVPGLPMSWGKTS